MRMRIARIRLLVEDMQMAEKAKIKMPFLQSIPGEMAKLTSAIEDDAREFIQKEIPQVHEKRKKTFVEAKERLHQDVGGALSDVSSQLDDVLNALMGDNGAPKDGEPRPTSGDSSQSPDKPVQHAAPDVGYKTYT